MCDPEYTEGKGGFANRAGRPLSQTNLLRRSLHPILRELKAERAGFHAFRRFRTTWLSKQRAPRELITYWIGHAKKSVTDEYSRLSEDVEFRKEVAEKSGAGFVVPPPMIPMRPRISEERRVVVTA